MKSLEKSVFYIVAIGYNRSFQIYIEIYNYLEMSYGNFRANLESDVQIYFLELIA